MSFLPFGTTTDESDEVIELQFNGSGNQPIVIEQHSNGKVMSLGCLIFVIIFCGINMIICLLFIQMI
ncbi:hypothetical protein CL6EHI_c00030 [Entamoeba histolytica]|uniref:Uncharacterized protein n=1 Tax=Entamoeba histolytica TaxID=5759 RepID=A0A175JF90_ENTHI|nr:hypothetical protein CL6EHI_c00030 [Entamoeba histolytica]